MSSLIGSLMLVNCLYVVNSLSFNVDSLHSMQKHISPAMLVKYLENTSTRHHGVRLSRINVLTAAL
jgi:hypothetical protein